jgi:hypothetical protein
MVTTLQPLVNVFDMFFFQIHKTIFIQHQIHTTSRIWVDEGCPSLVDFN